MCALLFVIKLSQNKKKIVYNCLTICELVDNLSSRQTIFYKKIKWRNGKTDTIGLFSLLIH